MKTMTGYELKAARLSSSWTQSDTAEKLGVTQAYLSMVERGTRVVSTELAARAVAVLKVPATALPLGPYRRQRRDEFYFQNALGALGYSGFAYMRGTTKLNPAALLMEALDSDNLDSRVTEALPWLPVAYPKVDWSWLVFNAKVWDRQNRLAFVVTLAAEIAAAKGDSAVGKALLGIVDTLERSRLAAEDTLCNQSMTNAERKWLRTHRLATAKHWNLLTDLCIERLDHALQ
jgi:DNA-binding XRE family transcriptional regulator